MPQGPQNGPTVARSVEFEFERDLRELEVELVLKVEFELEPELELELKLGLELLRDARRALELQAKDQRVAHNMNNLRIEPKMTSGEPPIFKMDSPRCPVREARK